MLLSHQKQFVFIRIFKTGSTSVAEMLLPYARWRERAAYGHGLTKRAIVGFNLLTGLQHNGMKHITGYHKFAKAREVRAKLGAERFDRYFSFSFVRNPYDRLVSLYFHLKRLTQHPLHEKVKGMEFPDYVEWGLEQSPDLLLDSLTDADGRLLLDHVGRLETFAADVQQVCARLGVPFDGARHENATPGRGKDYRVYYDQRSRARVAAYFAKDLEQLGYDFDGVTGPIAIPA